jgi:hypothetical protein
MNARLALGLVVVLCATATPAFARPRCGDGSGDMAAVSALAADVTQHCDCCGPRRTNAACVVGVLKPAIRTGRLSRLCARKLLRDTIRACPFGSGGAACRACNSDDDCGAGEVCDCRLASCGKSGGVCVARPEVCPQLAAPVCGCDGMTYPNDCERLRAGVCKRSERPCVEAGGCFDTNEGRCTGEVCSPASPCEQPNQLCSPKCVVPPPAGTCFDLLARRCTSRSCGADAACLPNEACLPVCPPPPPQGKCFVMVDSQCSDEPCGPDRRCRQPNEFCSPACLGSTDGCASDADCDDGNGCSADRCVDGTCEHTCLCVGPLAERSCCPGPAALCRKPCGADSAGSCGGDCPLGASCTNLTDGGACGCVSERGGPCGGNLFAPPLQCAAGLVCKQSLPDATGVCVAPEGPCGDVKTCGGICPLVHPDGTTEAGRCFVVVVDPTGEGGGPFGPMCKCFPG